MRRRSACAGRSATPSPRPFRPATNATSAWPWTWPRITSRWSRTKSRRCSAAARAPSRSSIWAMTCSDAEAGVACGTAALARRRGGELLHHGQQQLAVALVQIRGVAAELREEPQLVVGEILRVHLAGERVAGKELRDRQIERVRRSWTACRARARCGRSPPAKDSSAAGRSSFRYPPAIIPSAGGRRESWCRFSSVVSSCPVRAVYSRGSNQKIIIIIVNMRRRQLQGPVFLSARDRRNGTPSCLAGKPSRGWPVRAE